MKNDSVLLTDGKVNPSIGMDFANLEVRPDKETMNIQELVFFFKESFDIMIRYGLVIRLCWPQSEDSGKIFGADRRQIIVPYTQTYVLYQHKRFWLDNKI